MLSAEILRSDDGGMSLILCEIPVMGCISRST